MNTAIIQPAQETQGRCTAATTSSIQEQKRRWSPELTRSRLSRSFSRLCARSTLGIPSPWAEVEITEE